jgi:hypothetical protein
MFGGQWCLIAKRELYKNFGLELSTLPPDLTLQTWNDSGNFCYITPLVHRKGRTGHIIAVVLKASNRSHEYSYLFQFPSYFQIMFVQDLF